MANVHQSTWEETDLNAKQLLEKLQYSMYITKH